MSRGQDDQIFTFVAVRADGAMPALHLATCPGQAEACVKAAAWLSTHPSCERVQIWSEREFVGEISLPDTDRQRLRAELEEATPASAED